MDVLFGPEVTFGSYFFMYPPFRRVTIYFSVLIQELRINPVAGSYSLEKDSGYRFLYSSILDVLILCTSTRYPLVAIPKAFWEVGFDGDIRLLDPPLSSPVVIGSCLAPWSWYTAPGIIFSVT